MTAAKRALSPLALRYPYDPLSVLRPSDSLVSESILTALPRRKSGRVCTDKEETRPGTLADLRKDGMSGWSETRTGVPAWNVSRVCGGECVLRGRVQ